jgi:hypothetical protein
MRNSRLSFTLPLALVLFAFISWAQTQSAAPQVASGYTVAGVVLNSVNNQPLAGMTITLAPVTARLSTQRLVTTADGRFLFTGLPRGKYSLAGTGKGYRDQALNQHDNYSTAVVVGPELDAEHIVFRLQPDAAIAGRVFDEENEPVQQATLRLYRKDTEEGQEKAVPREGATTDDQGNFHIAHLAPGTYYLVASARPWYAQNYYRQQLPPAGDPETAARIAQEAAEVDKAYPVTFYPNVADAASASPIVLHPGDHFEAVMVMQAVKSIHLRIKGSPHKQGFSVNLKQRIFDSIEPYYQGISMSPTEDGSMEVSGLAPGHYIVELGAGEPSDKSGGRGSYLEVDLNGDVELNPAASPSFAQLSGIVRFEAAPPPELPVFLHLTNRESDESFDVELSRSGEFSFPSNQLRPGNYELLMGNAQGFTLQKMAASGATISGRTLEITSGTTVHLACIASHGIGQVDGVALRDDKPEAGIMIVLVPKDVIHNQPLFRRDQSDSDGTFSLLNVVPGAYTVVAIADGWDLEWANPAVLQPYLKHGENVQVPGDGRLNIKVQVQ